MAAQNKPDYNQFQLFIAGFANSRYSGVMEASRFNNSMIIKAKSVVVFLYRHIVLCSILGLIAFAAIQYNVRPQSHSLQEIQQIGVLHVLISNDPDAQYAFNNEHYGFEYQLLKTFSDSLGVELQLQIVPYGELFSLLNAGVADIAVGGILANEYINSVSQPSIPWYQADVSVVYKRGQKRPRKISDLQGQEVLSSARFYQMPVSPGLNIKDDYRSEYDLLTAVNQGKAKYAISTNYRAKHAKHYLPRVSRGFLLGPKLDLVWALPKRHDPVLKAVLNQFLQTALDYNLPKKLAHQHFNLTNKLNAYDSLDIHRKIKERLPEYEYAFRKAARKGNIDWTLLAAMAYQESHWSNDATSPTGVKGLMQLTNKTADFLGVNDRLNVDETIQAASEYMGFLKSRIPSKVPEPERTWFAVGAYNIGLQHILEAYKKARKLNLNAHQWSTISHLLPTLYGRRFPRGVQARNYVQRIQVFADILRFYDTHQKEIDVAALHE